MDNLTHSLVGAVLADLLLPPAAPRGRRGVFLAAGVVAANLPDLDLAWVGLTPRPLGYLLHHRGYTHTVLGCVALALLLVLLAELAPRARGHPPADRLRMWVLLGAGVASHLVLDAGNTYGVHPFHPLDPRWYYGDAVFIFEPWLWVLLGVPLAWSRGSRGGRAAVLVLASAPVLAMAGFGLVPRGSAAAVAAAGALLAVLTGPLTPAGRAAVALTSGAVFFAGMTGLSGLAASQARAQLEPRVRGALLDVVVNPNPGNPACWQVLGVEKDEGRGELAIHRGTLSLLPGWQPPAECLSHRLAEPAATAAGGGSLAWRSEIRQPLGPLRDLARRDCWVRAWLQFGRAPLVSDGTIRDARFDAPGRGNFTAMRLGLESVTGCPAHVTSWAMPRADLLQPPVAGR